MVASSGDALAGEGFIEAIQARSVARLSTA